MTHSTWDNGRVCANSLKTYNSTESTWDQISPVGGCRRSAHSFPCLAHLPLHHYFRGFFWLRSPLWSPSQHFKMITHTLHPICSLLAPISPVGLNSSDHRSSSFSEPSIACLSWPSHFPAPLWQLPGIISQKKYSCPLNNTGLHCVGPLTRGFSITTCTVFNLVGNLEMQGPLYALVPGISCRGLKHPWNLVSKRILNQFPGVPGNNWVLWSRKLHVISDGMGSGAAAASVVQEATVLALESLTLCVLEEPKTKHWLQFYAYLFLVKYFEDNIITTKQNCVGLCYMGYVTGTHKIGIKNCSCGIKQQTLVI